jgi:phage I-like protein
MEMRALNAEKQIVELNAAQLKKDAAAAVDEAITHRKIAPASKAEYLALCATKEGLESFRKIAAVSPVIISTEQAPATAPASSEKVALNSEELAFAKAAGKTPEEWAKFKEANK